MQTLTCNGTLQTTITRTNVKCEKLICVPRKCCVRCPWCWQRTARIYKMYRINNTSSNITPSIPTTTWYVTKIHQHHETSASSCDHFLNVKRRQLTVRTVVPEESEWTLVLSFPQSEWKHSLIYGCIMRIRRLLLFVSPDPHITMPQCHYSQPQRCRLI